MAPPNYASLVSVEADEVESAYRSVHGRPTDPSDLAHNFWRRLVEGYSHEDVLNGIRGLPFVTGQTIPPGPPQFGHLPAVDYQTFVQVEIDEIAATYRKANGVDPAPSDLAHNAWRRLAEHWSFRDILHDILREPLEDGGIGGAARGGRRPGRVGTVGRSFVDGAGPFFPLGETLFWAPRGWKFERERVRRNLAWLAGHLWNYIRILCDVGGPAWVGNEIDSTWPDYEEVMAGLIDAAYDEYGLRVEATIWGGSPRDPLRATDLMAAVSRGREHKFVNFEAANESFQNGPDLPTVKEMARRLQSTGILTAESSPQQADQASFERLVDPGQIASWHADRTYGDNDWRFVRQAWDAKYFPWPVTQNEPKGPASSVSPNSNPLQLAMHRALGIMCGTGAYVLHNAAGISGIDGEHAVGGRRTANLWEMPGIDEIMRAVRGIDPLLPAGVESWERSNDTWTPPNQVHPLPATHFWSTGDGGPERGVNRNYAAVSGQNFITMPCGVHREGASFKARWACTIKVHNPLTRRIFVEGPLSPDQELWLPGSSDTMAAYIVRGMIF
jgi:hypothetical protein